jgi:hypothetical protein
MRNILKGVWNKIKWGLFLIVYTAGVVGWCYFYQEFRIIRAEANQTWQGHIERTENKNGDVSMAPAIDSVPPIEVAEEIKPSSPASGIADIIPKIYQLESSGGKNDSCKQKGLVNGYGYGTWTNHLTCFDSKEEVENKVVAWFEEKLQTYSLAESVCLYNTGRATSDCLYYQKFKTI